MTETAKLEALKPCPFCGSHNIDPLGWASADSAGPACDDCGASAGKATQTVEQNVTAWNTSAPSVSRPAVKGLEWKENSANSIWTGELAFGAYYTAYDEGDGWRLFRGQFLSSYGDHELAFGKKAVVLAAAQSDFEQRVLSSLVGGADVTR